MSFNEKKSKPKKNITLNIPQIYDDHIMKLVDKNRVSSRSDAIRKALKSFLETEFNNLKKFGFFKNISEEREFEELIKDVRT